MRTATRDTLYARFAATAAALPDAPALEVGDATLTYRQLEETARRLAAWLVAEHGEVPGRVALLASRTVAAYAGYLAVLSLGATVVPLNPAFPAARNATLCRLAGADAVLIDSAGAGQAGAFPHVRTVLPITHEPPAAPFEPRPAAAREVAYVLFTSGSTGVPKGVPIRHANLTAYLDHCVSRYAVGPGARLSQEFDLTFDPSVFDLFVTWSAGATLVVPSGDERLAPVEFINRRRLTHWYSGPSHLSLADDSGDLSPGGMPHLRWTMLGGEQLTGALAARWAEAAPGSVMENVYGPTELTITCAAYRLPASRSAWPRTANGTVPIGAIYPHLEHVVLDEDGRAAPEGELCVRGGQRFSGYLDPADDVGRFVTFENGVSESYDGSAPLTARHWYRTGDRVRDDDGRLTHLSRLDSQVKVYGHRVEPGEVEAVLRRHEQVRDAVVLAVEGAHGDAELVAAYTGRELPYRELAAHVRAWLPAHMVPRRLVHLPRLPLNHNGKVDRRALSERLVR
ncbi:D-alanine--poly(phosphoribitol) ligase [Nonomuraea monospora]|uniref:D-alanine--poly(Phosphoribitol) ligase n=1 Tax=Nonomuraea monospora TaxID=568818 RepID=A0ABN3CVQ3_9ACTN